MNRSTDEKLSTRLDSLVQQAVDEAIERHRIRGESIAVAGDNDKVKIIPPEEIMPLAEKLKQRQAEVKPTFSS